MNKELSVWALLKNGQFEKASEKADEEYMQTGDILVLRNKIYALLHLKKYNEIVFISERIIKNRHGETNTDFISLGIANWMLGNIENSIYAWQQSQKSIYQDAAGGIDTQVFLYFAAVKIGQDSLERAVVKAVKKLLKSKRTTNWPGPLGHYLINEINDIELFSYISAIPILKERQLCQAYFVSAIKILETGNKDGYYKKLTDCISYGPNSYLEQMYYLAKGELETSNLQNADFLETATLKQGAKYITREAPTMPGAPAGAGGGVEAVVEQGGTTGNVITPVKKIKP